jgi:hypothetical protein
MIPSLEYSSAVITKDSFYRLMGKSDDYRRIWCCDAFSVNEACRSVPVQRDGQSERTIIEFNVAFRSPTDLITFEWDLTALKNLSLADNNTTILFQTLCDKGVRCSPSIDATNAIINAILNPAITFYEGR